MWPDGRLPAVADDLLDLSARVRERDVERLEDPRRDALLLADQPEEQVLGADVVVVEQTCFFLREHNHSAGAVGEAFEHAPRLRPVSRAMPGHMG